jgi:hypothetical protein
MDPSYLQMDKESMGHWWILRPRKDNAGNAFVYQGFGRGFRSSRCARYQFDANISLQRSRLHRRLKLVDHLYEFSHGLRVHFLHCPAPMNLHGVFRSSELISNLLVEHA